MNLIVNLERSQGQSITYFLNLLDSDYLERHTICPIINRLSADILVGKMVKTREDERFKAVGPDSMVIPYHPAALQPVITKPVPAEEAEIWFDWAFVDFWKSNYHTVQRGFSVEPDQLSSTGGTCKASLLVDISNRSAVGQSAEAQMLIASLRDVIRQQSEEIDALTKRLKESLSAPVILTCRVI